MAHSDCRLQVGINAVLAFEQYSICCVHNAQLERSISNQVLLQLWQN